MSRSYNVDYPQFAYSQSYYSSEPSLDNAPFSQWAVPDSGTAPLPASSPSLSVTTAQSAPHPRANFVGSNQPNPGYANNPMELQLPGFSYLPSPQAPRPRSALDAGGNTTPMDRYIRDEQPWSAVSMRSTSANPSRAFSFQPGIDAGFHNSGPGSEVESIPPTSDSDYYTMPQHSPIINDPSQSGQAISPTAAFGLRNLNVTPTSREQPDRFSVTSASQLDQTSQYSGRSAGRSTASAKEFPCSDCGEISKCRSDYKKHMLKHNKPHKCDAPNCRRGGKGFGTPNDLERHRKSVHGIGAEKNSYQCASETCKSKEKIWPRLDNFKQHIHRMHEDEDEQDLIQRSAYRAPERAVPQTLSMPLDIDLAGIATERQYISNESEDPVSGISLTPDQESDRWTTHHSLFRVPSVHLDQEDRSSIQANEHSASPTMSDPRQLLHPALNDTSRQPCPSNPLPRQQQVSNAPQTKAGQLIARRMAKMTRYRSRNNRQPTTNPPRRSDQASSHDMCSEGCDEKHSPIRRQSDLITDISYIMSQNEDVNGIPLDLQVELHEMSRVLSKLIKARGVRSPKSRQKSSTATKQKKCEVCSASFARTCDLKKHRMRHTKPYGCTFPGCKRRSGSKNDWKRHEDSQHPSYSKEWERFRCGLLSTSAQTTCHSLFKDSEDFQNHLTKDHMINPHTPQFLQQVKSSKFGTNHTGRFWCGFCRDLISSHQKRNEWWAERFNHIDAHIAKEKRSIEEWFCVVMSKSKGQIELEEDLERKLEEASSPDDSELPPTQPQDETMEGQTQHTPTTFDTVEVIAPLSPVIDLSHPKPCRPRTEHNRYCCSCDYGPLLTHMYPICISCDHHLCGNCPVKEENGGTLDMDMEWTSGFVG